MNEFLPKKYNRRHLKDIPLAPVLDLLTVVIFFLMLSTSFVELTKQTLPPSSVIQITDAASAIPLNLKLFVRRQGGNSALTFHWTGAVPGEEKILLQAPAQPQAMRDGAAGLGKKIKEKYPGETSVQLGLGQDFTYQEMISVMDGVREHFDDVVLVSPNE